LTYECIGPPGLGGLALLEAKGVGLSAREAQQEQQAGEDRRRSGRDRPGVGKRGAKGSEAAHPRNL